MTDRAYSYTPDEELCPSCGTWVTQSQYNHEAGFCINCAPLDPFCVWCGFPISDPLQKLHKSCRQELWLRANANAIDEQISLGHSSREAIEIVRLSIRPNCWYCREAISGRKPTDDPIFCKSKPGCRKAYRRFRNLRYRLGRERATFQIKLELGHLE